MTHGDEAGLWRWQDRSRWHGPGHSGVTNADGALDLVITNAIVMDPVLGVLKAGYRGSRRAALSEWAIAGNPGIMDGIDPNMVVESGGGRHGPASI